MSASPWRRALPGVLALGWWGACATPPRVEARACCGGSMEAGAPRQLAARHARRLVPVCSYLRVARAQAGALNDNVLAWMGCELKMVDLSFNDITGQFTNSISTIKNLTVLGLSNNGALPRGRLVGACPHRHRAAAAAAAAAARCQASAHLLWCACPHLAAAVPRSADGRHPLDHERAAQPAGRGPLKQPPGVWPGPPFPLARPSVVAPLRMCGGAGPTTQPAAPSRCFWGKGAAQATRRMIVAPA